MIDFVMPFIATTTFYLIIVFHNENKVSNIRKFLLWLVTAAANILIQWFVQLLSLPYILGTLLQQVLVMVVGYFFLYEEKGAKPIFVFTSTAALTHIFFTLADRFFEVSEAIGSVKIGLTVMFVGLYLWAIYSLIPIVQRLQRTFKDGWVNPLVPTICTYALIIFLIEYFGKTEYYFAIIVVCLSIVALYALLYILILKLRELSDIQDHVELLEIQKEIEKQLREKQELYFKLAYTDYLTGLGNRTKLGHDIETFFKTNDQCLPLVFYTIDINGLKEINDTMGHNAGDTILKDFAAILKKAFSEEAYIYRVGGDEFSIILRQSNRGQAEVYIYELEEAQRDYNRMHDIKISFAIGYSMQRLKQTEQPCEHDCKKCLENLMADSDKRMYVDKQRIKPTRIRSNF